MFPAWLPRHPHHTVEAIGASPRPSFLARGHCLCHLSFFPFRDLVPSFESLWFSMLSLFFVWLSSPVAGCPLLSFSSSQMFYHLAPWNLPVPFLYVLCEHAALCRILSICSVDWEKRKALMLMKPLEKDLRLHTQRLYYHHYDFILPGF